jgi:GT2 family glycosyltransferase
MMISVAIPTYNREQPLRETLAGVMGQNYQSFEVLVIDQTRTHESSTQVYLEELANAGKIRWFRVNWASLPGARNYAVRRAVGEIILFIDDDVQLPDGFLAAHADNYLEKPDVGCVAGRVLDRMKLDDSGGNYAIEYLPPSAMDAAIAWYFIDLVHTVQPQQVLSARGCNMSFRASVFTEWGLSFDERFAGSAVREESDFCLRLRSTGFKIWYDPNACLVHLGEESGGCHDISTRSIEYQVTFYHNHFLMGLKNLTAWQCLRFFAKLFDCHVLGNPPCYKSRSPIKILTRFTFYILGFISVLSTAIQSLRNDGQIYTRQDNANLE